MEPGMRRQRREGCWTAAIGRLARMSATGRPPRFTGRAP